MRLEIKMRGRCLHRTADIRETNPGWGQENFADIESLALPLPTGHRIVLAGFEAYNFFVEASQALSARETATVNPRAKIPRVRFGKDANMAGVF